MFFQNLISKMTLFESKNALFATFPKGSILLHTWFGGIFIRIHWADISKFIRRIKQKQNYTTTHSSSSFGIWVKASLRPHHSEILTVLCLGFLPLFSRIHIRLKTQASSQWTPPINLIGFCPCCWRFKLADLTAHELLVCPTPHGTKRSRRQVTDGIFGFNPNTG